jgi:hypothetical protein
MAKKVVVELPTREELVALATEVNAVLNLDAPIKFGKKVSDDDLIEAIRKECTNNVYEIDFIEDPNDPAIPIYSEVQKEIFGLIDVVILPGSPNDAPNEDDVAYEEPETEIEEPEDIPEPIATKTKADKKQKANSDAVSSSKTDKQAPVKGKTAVAKEKASKDARFTRSDAWKIAVEATANKPLTKEELIVACDKVFVDNGGVKTSNSTNYFKYLIAPFIAFGILEITSDKKLKFVP